MVPVQYSFADVFGLVCDLLIIAVTVFLLVYALGGYLVRRFHFIGHHNTAAHGI